MAWKASELPRNFPGSSSRELRGKYRLGNFRALGTTAMHIQRATSGAAGNGLYTTIKYMRVASGIGMGTKIKHLRRTTSGTAGNGLGATMNLRRTTSAAANNGMNITITPLCSAASFEVNSEPHTGERSSVRLCVGPELARCVHKIH